MHTIRMTLNLLLLEKDRHKCGGKAWIEQIHGHESGGHQHNRDTVAHLIPDSEVQRYARAPSASTVSSVSTFQEAIRDALGTEYETFLQGSYKNDTSVRDLNDVDIVALRKYTVSTVFSEERYPTSVSWNDIFAEVRARLEAAQRFRGKISYGDKCVKVNAEWKADVVPAVRIRRYDQDPVAIYSFREAKERKNFPRVHYENGVEKHQQTGETFKPVVRMFKRWVENHWPSDATVAPSFYVESLIYNVPNDRFESDLATAFFRVGYWIEKNVTPTSPPVVSSVAKDKDILVDSEWKLANFARFHTQLVTATSLVATALKASTQADAVRYWRAAFNQ